MLGSIKILYKTLYNRNENITIDINKKILTIF